MRCKLRRNSQHRINSNSHNLRTNLLRRGKCRHQVNDVTGNWSSGIWLSMSGCEDVHLTWRCEPSVYYSHVGYSLMITYDNMTVESARNIKFHLHFVSNYRIFTDAEAHESWLIIIVAVTQRRTCSTSTCNLHQLNGRSAQFSDFNRQHL